MSNTLLLNPTAYEAGLLTALHAHTHDREERRAAFERFAQTGLPHRRLEAWKWTDLRAALVDGMSADAVQVQVPSLFSGQGLFAITLDETGAHWGTDVPAGVTLRVTDEVSKLMPLASDQPMANLAAALSNETLMIIVSENTHVHAPLHLFRAGLSGDTHRRIMISLGDGAQLTVMDTIEGAQAGAFFDNLLVECRLGEGASLTRMAFADGGAAGVDHALYTVHMKSTASFEQHVLTRGAKRARLETRIHFDGQGAAARLFGASMLGGSAHADLTTHIIHDAEECFTEQQHKTVLKDKAVGIFQGKFLVERSGQKADANMQANALLLSDDATINHKPELEIYADDVQCAHGSTSGALDDEALFYLRQRGLSEHQARALLVEAFLAEVFDECPHEGVADIFRAQMVRWLSDDERSGHGL